MRGKVAVTALHILPAVRRPDPSLPDIPKRRPPPRPSTDSKKMYNIVDQLWKHVGGDDTVGDGTTMDAIRNEKLTGRPSGRTFHAIKATAAVNGLKKFLNRTDTTPADRALAEDLIRQLQQAQEE